MGGTAGKVARFVRLYLPYSDDWSGRPSVGGLFLPRLDAAALRLHAGRRERKPNTIRWRGRRGERFGSRATRARPTAIAFLAAPATPWRRHTWRSPALGRPPSASLAGES